MIGRCGTGSDGQEFLGRTRTCRAAMTRPTADRVAGTPPHPRVAAAGVPDRHRALRLDLELAGAKNLTGLGGIVETQHGEDFAAARAAGLRLGWTPAGSTPCSTSVWRSSWPGTAARSPTSTSGVVDEFDEQLAQTMQLSRSSLRAYRARLASLRQLLFEIGVHDQPPRRRPWSRTLEQRFADVTMAEPIRAVLLRYVQTRAECVASSLGGVPGQRPAAVRGVPHRPAPRGHQPAALQRSHVEEFLIWNRNRPWRGPQGTPRPVSVAVAQSAVLSLRNLLEDIAVWGWAEAPSRRLVFAADVPKLDRALPRALAPDVDARLMAAVVELADPFARAGLQVLRGTGLRVGELLDLEVGAVVDYGPAGTWLRVPLGKLATERTVPLDEPTLAALERMGASARGTSPESPHPRTGSPPTSCSPSTAADWERPGSATDSSPQWPQPACADPAGQPLTVTPHQLRHTYATTLANAGMSL